MRVIFAVLVATCYLVEVKSAMNFTNIFPNIHRCAYNQQFLNRCIERSIREMRRYLIRGVQQLNIPSYNPYFIDKRTIRMKDEIFNGTATFTNIRIDGLTDYDTYEVKYIGPDLEMRLDIFFPIIEFDADYDIDGVLMLEPIKRRGHEMIITCIDVRAFILLNGTDYINSDGWRHFKIESAPVDLHVRRAMISFEDLHDNYFGNIKLNEYLNAQFETYYPHIMIKVGYFATEIIQKIANKIYSNFPVRKLLPYYY